MEFKADNLTKFKALADKIKATLEVENHAIKEAKSHTAYYDNLPEGHTRDTVAALSDYNSKFVTASHIAVGEIATGILAKDKKVDTIEAEIGMFGKNDHINITVNRSKTYNNFLAKDDQDKEITKHLVMTTSVSMHSAKGTALKSVKEAMGEEFHGKFKT